MTKGNQKKLQAEISSAEYNVEIHVTRVERGRRSISATVYSQADWAAPFEVTFELPDDAEDLRNFIEYARRGRLRMWLLSNGYDSYGNGYGRYGRLRPA
jgi:hypothetical protein